MSEVRSLLVEEMRRHALGGAAVAVVQKGERPAFECLGLADRDSARGVDPDTVFRIASISKTMTAIGLMQLRDQGLLDLDDPVNKHLRAFTVEPPPGGADVTFRHLLTHTAGIGELPRLSDVVRREAWGSGKPGTAPADLAAMYRGILRTETVAGAKWAYANHGFAVLGQLVEDISGCSFAEYMRDQVFRPLDMSSTEYTRTDRTDHRVATGYHWVFGRLRHLRDYDLTLLGPGSVLSPLTDMARYGEWLLHGGAGPHGEVLAPATLAEMMSPQYRVDRRLPGMGLAFFVDRMDEHRVVGHDGNVPGFASALMVAPDDGVGVVVLTNTATLIGAHLLASALLRSLLGIPDPATQLPSTDVAASPHIWSELVGYYAPPPGFLTNARSWQGFAGEVQIVVKNRRLVMRALSPVGQLRHGLELHAIDPADPLLFAVKIEGLVVPVAFDRGRTGQIDRLAISSPANAALNRRSTWRSAQVRRRLGTGALLATATYRRWRKGQR